MAVKKPVAGKIVGVDVDKQGRRLYPGMPILYWTSDGGDRMRCWPGRLNYQQSNGVWAINYEQRAHLTHNVSAPYADKPKIHSWTFTEAYEAYFAKGK